MRNFFAEFGSFAPPVERNHGILVMVAWWRSYDHVQTGLFHGHACHGLEGFQEPQREWPQCFCLILSGKKRRNIGRSHVSFNQWLTFLWTRTCYVSLASSSAASTTDFWGLATKRECNTCFFCQVVRKMHRTIVNISWPHSSLMIWFWTNAWYFRSTIF